MTYLYQVISTGEQIEVEQRISDERWTHYAPLGRTFLRLKPGDPTSRNKKLLQVKRLISGAPGFNLIPGESGGWANDGYSKPENFRKAEAKLGHKVRRQL